MARARASCIGLAVVAAGVLLLASHVRADELANEAALREAQTLGGAKSPMAAAGGEAASSVKASLLDQPLVRTGGSLAIVLGLIFGLAAIAKRVNASSGGLLSGSMGGGRVGAPSGLLEVLGRYPIGRGQTLLLLRMDTRILLVAQSSGGGLRWRGGGAGSLVTLSEVRDAEDVASILMKVQDSEQLSTAARFGAMLGAFDAKHDEVGLPGGVVDLTRQPLARRSGQGGSLRAKLGAMRSADRSIVRGAGR